MIIIYILLVIIAIGVLLASKAGQGLLKVLLILALIAGVLYLAFWIVVITIAFFTSDMGKSFIDGIFQLIIHIIGSLLILAVLYYGGNYLIKIVKDKKKRIELLRSIKNLPYYTWKYNKVLIISSIMGLLSFALGLSALLMYLKYFGY